MFYKGRHCISALDFTRDGLLELFWVTRRIKDLMLTQRGRIRLKTRLLRENGTQLSVINLFGEPSTRTLDKFEEAVLALGGRYKSKSIQFSSEVKGEQTENTVAVLAEHHDALVIRSDDKFQKNVLRRAADTIERFREKGKFQHSPIVINAGEGNIEHPTQVFVDLYTVWEREREKFEAGTLTWVFIGDIPDSRTIHSGLYALSLSGGTFCGVSFKDNDLPEKIRKHISGMPGCRYTKHTDIMETARAGDVFYFTRLQDERKNLGPADLQKREQEYMQRFGASEKFRKAMRKDAIALHPMPHRGEFKPLLGLEDERFVYFDQAANGIPTTMALFEKLFNGNPFEI